MASAATSARDAWIASVVDDEERRRQLRETAYCLQDFKQARLESLEHTLDLRSWPPLARMRFIDAWQRLKDGSAVDPVTAVVPALAPETPFVGHKAPTPLPVEPAPHRAPSPLPAPAVVSPEGPPQPVASPTIADATMAPRCKRSTETPANLCLPTDTFQQQLAETLALLPSPPSTPPGARAVRRAPRPTSQANAEAELRAEVKELRAEQQRLLAAKAERVRRDAAERAAADLHAKNRGILATNVELRREAPERTKEILRRGQLKFSPGVAVTAQRAAVRTATIAAARIAEGASIAADWARDRAAQAASIATRAAATARGAKKGFVTGWVENAATEAASATVLASAFPSLLDELSERIIEAQDAALSIGAATLVSEAVPGVPLTEEPQEMENEVRDAASSERRHKGARGGATHTASSNPTAAAPVTAFMPHVPSLPTNNGPATPAPARILMLPIYPPIFGGFAFAPSASPPIYYMMPPRPAAAANDVSGTRSPVEAARRAEPPANLGWIKTADALSGRVYFYNTVTGATSLTWPPRT